MNQPLAERMRPQNLKEFMGQENLIGAGRLLRQAIESDQLPSMIFWGPPGTGKTTLAQIIAIKTKAQFRKLSATSSGLKDLRVIINEAEGNHRLRIRTILFIDEIHRWNKKQQDALLPHIEKGVITLIGATTENPSFEVVGALLSRTRVFVFEKIDKKQIETVIAKALRDKKRGLGEEKISIDKKAKDMLAQLANGDVRSALNILEYATYAVKNNRKTKITKEDIKEALQKSALYYDKNGEEHYNLISALHKAMRGSDADAALYYLARMLAGGEDPLYVARRLIRFASEDIGIANSLALDQAVATYHACHYVGMPECGINLAQAVTYMAKSKKSNALYVAYAKVMADVEQYGNLPVPLHIRNAPTDLMKNLGYGKDYKYSPQHQYKEKQNYFPEELKNRKYFGDSY